VRSYEVVVQRQVDIPKFFEQGGEGDVGWWGETRSVYMAYFDEDPVGFSTCHQILPDDVGRDVAVTCLLQTHGWSPDDA